MGMGLDPDMLAVPTFRWLCLSIHVEKTWESCPDPEGQPCSWATELSETQEQPLRLEVEGF